MTEINRSIDEILSSSELKQTGKYKHMSFEGKHADEVILYYCRPSWVQLKYELLKLLLPMLLIDIIFIVLFASDVINIGVLVFGCIIVTLLFAFSVFFKIYRARNNYLYITSKRVLFHGIEWFFKDYVKKINYENIRNINYFTESFIGKMFNFGALEIQSSHGWAGDIKVYHIHHGKMLTHYIDKLMSLSLTERARFAEFDIDYFNS